MSEDDGFKKVIKDIIAKRQADAADLKEDENVAPDAIPPDPLDDISHREEHNMFRK